MTQTLHNPPREPEITLADWAKRYPKIEKGFEPGSVEVGEEPKPPGAMSRIMTVLAAVGGNVFLALIAGVLTLWIVYYFGLAPEDIFGGASATPIIPSE